MKFLDIIKKYDYIAYAAIYLVIISVVFFLGRKSAFTYQDKQMNQYEKTLVNLENEKNITTQTVDSLNNTIIMLGSSVTDLNNALNAQIKKTYNAEKAKLQVEMDLIDCKQNKLFKN